MHGQGGAYHEVPVDVQGPWGAALVHDITCCRLTEENELCRSAVGQHRARGCQPRVQALLVAAAAASARHVVRGI